MRKSYFPSIRKTQRKFPLPAKSHDFNTPFMTMFNQFKLKKHLKLKSNDKTDNSNKKNYYSTKDNFLKKEEDKILIEGQKYLIKLYESNYSSLIDRIKTESPRDNDINIIKPVFSRNKLMGKMSILGSEKGKKEANKRTETISNDTKFTLMKKKYGFDKFKKTNYVSPSCMKDFYDKYSKFNVTSRKYFLENVTPTLAFIKSSNEEKIVPNPLGLIRRNGDTDKLNYNYQKVGDDYMTVLSNSLRYSEQFNSLDISGNRLSNIGVEKLFKVLNENKMLSRKLLNINLSENNMGNRDLTDLNIFLQDPDNSIEHLNLYGNLLGDENTIKICENLGKYIEHKLLSLNLGKNNIHDESSNAICFMAKSCTGLRSLNLNHNWLHNKAAAQIINTLSNNFELKTLDLSWNCIGDDLVIIPSYEELVNSQLKYPEKNFDNFALDEALGALKIKLRRNPLLPPLDDKTKKDKKEKNDKNKPAQNKTEEIKEPSKVPVKPKTPSDFAIALGEYFCNESIDLIHLDISHNNINYIDSKLLSEKVKSNHTILGIHLDGNEMEINELGFINPIEKSSKNKTYFPDSQITYSIDKDYKLRKTTIDTVRKIRSKNNCWICDGFREIEFEYIPEVPIDDPNNYLLKIHLNFDGYKAFDMIYNDGKYHMARMCPPGEIDYFFTMNTEPVIPKEKYGNNKFTKIGNKSHYIKYTFDEEFMEEVKNQKEKLKYEIIQTNKNVTETSNQNLIEANKTQNNENPVKFPKSIISLDTSQKISIEIDSICKMNIKYNKKVVDEGYRKLIKFSLPRPEKIIDKFIKPRTPWSFPSSIWAHYGYSFEDYSEAYLNKCFKFDFDRCQFQKDFKTEESLDLLRAFLRERYKNIIDCYKYYSSMSSFSVWQITQNNLTEFINHCNNFCDKSYDINNVFLTQKTVCGNLIDKEDRKKKNKNLSDNLVRHQFLNLLVKVSKDKYITVLKTLTDPLEAVETAFDNHFDEALKGFEYHKWRKERYYNEKTDNFIRAYLPILDALYLSWAKQKGPTKKDVWMLLDEFNNLVQNIVDVNEYPLRENPYIFNMSMNLQVNEIYTDKHLNMTLPEFLEALCRVIDKASPYPLSENKEDWPMERRQAQPLVDKLENILPILIKLITHPDYKVLRDKFPTPPKDISTGLYTPNFDSPFYQGYVIKTSVKEGNDLDISPNENKEEEKKDENGDDTKKEDKNEDNKEDNKEDKKEENDDNKKNEEKVGEVNDSPDNNNGDNEGKNINNDNNQEENNENGNNGDINDNNIKDDATNEVKNEDINNIDLNEEKINDNNDNNDNNNNNNNKDEN